MTTTTGLHERPSPFESTDLTRVTRTLEADGYVLVEGLREQRFAIPLLQEIGRLMPQYSGALEHEVVHKPGFDDRAYSQSVNTIRAHTEAPGWHPSPRHLALYCHRQAECGGGHTDLLDSRVLLGLLEPDQVRLLRTGEVRFPAPEFAGATPQGTTVPLLDERAARPVFRFSYNLLTAGDYDPDLNAAPPPERLPLGAAGTRLAETVDTLFAAHRTSVLIPAGALLIWDNQRMLHARSRYEDRARHLTRYWVADG